MTNSLSPIFPRSFRTGDPLAPETQMGALVSREHMAKVLHYVALARESGGVIHCGPDMPADYSKVSNRSETFLTKICEVRNKLSNRQIKFL